ncbi:MAG: hypothetical protein PVG39_18425 [Desulfobacteraceae bacterium]|jgi:hypothetical protein
MTNKWVLEQSDIRKRLTAKETSYWKNIFRRILKVGLEFEFNLQDAKGSCEGSNEVCPCNKMHLNAPNECWKECALKEECDVPDEDCPRTLCTSFVSKCIECNEYDTNCSTCEHYYDGSAAPKAVRKEISKELSPSKSYGKITKYGVHRITTDGSLLGDHGVEIVTAGRRIDFWEFFKMANEIIKSAVKRGAWCDERCSIHTHLLTAYFGNVSKAKVNEQYAEGIRGFINELEKNVPEIVLVNFHQLCRLYQNAITWMTTGLSEKDRLTRWENFRVSVIGVSPTANSMPEVVQRIADMCPNEKEKYGWVNYIYCDFDLDNSVRRFHVEMRAMDGLLSPSAVAAVACLYYALVIKAIEMSRYGVIRLTDEWFAEACEIKSALMNGELGDYGGARFSNTSLLGPYTGQLINQSYDLLCQVKHILMKIGPAYNVLEKLAEKPCSIRRCEGDSWEDIENALKVEYSEETLLVRKVSEIVDLRTITGCKDEVEWLKKVTNKLIKETNMGMSEDAIEESISGYLQRQKRDGEMIFLDKIGSMSFV